ncbi:MAG: flagellar biosynthetic protein FliQ [Pseudomonadota bacterium]|jgi:flagellar biosynthetic protein FliQ
MDPQQVLSFGRDGLLTLLTVCGPIVLVVLAVGLVVSILQAATQIHEQTLSFVPKLLAAFATLAVAGPWMITKLVDYIQQVLMAIPTVVG